MWHTRQISPLSESKRYADYAYLYSYFYLQTVIFRVLAKIFTAEWFEQSICSPCVKPKTFYNFAVLSAPQRNIYAHTRENQKNYIRFRFLIYIFNVESAVLLFIFIYSFKKRFKAASALNTCILFPLAVCIMSTLCNSVTNHPTAPKDTVSYK